MEPIRQSQLAKIKTIKNAANVAVIGPITIGAIKLRGHAALLAGVDFDAVGILNPWWKTDGRTPVSGELLVGRKPPNCLA